MNPIFESIWQEAAVVAVLIVIIYTGHKGYWYWSPGVRAVIAQISHDRDSWKMLAIVLLKKNGIDLPEDFGRTDKLMLPGEEKEK